jgi:hypothetical protein
VVDRRRQARLGEEPCLEPLVLRELRGEQLQRHAPAEPQILRAVNGGHAAAPDRRLQPVGAAEEILQEQPALDAQPLMTPVVELGECEAGTTRSSVASTTSEAHREWS